MVKDSARLASKDPMTDSDRGENRYFCRALQQKHGNEHDAYAERRQEGRNGHFVGADHDGLMQRLTHGHVTLDVFNDHGAVVDQDSDRQGKSTQGHGVQRLACEVDEQDGGDDGQRVSRRE